MGQPNPWTTLGTYNVTTVVAGRLFGLELHEVWQLRVAYYWFSFVVLLVDFFISGVPVRLLHFYQPLVVSLLYNMALIVFTFFTYRQGPFYRVADYFGQDSHVR